MRTATIHIAMPGSINTVDRTFRVSSKALLARQCSREIECFARSRGVSRAAVNWDITWGGR